MEEFLQKIKVSEIKKIPVQNIKRSVFLQRTMDTRLSNIHKSRSSMKM